MRALWILALLLLSFFSIEPVFAQPFPNEDELEQLLEQGVVPDDLVVQNASPLTGSLMAAALETAGYAAQSQVLEHLGGMFNSLGALIYLVFLIIGVFSVTIYGSYRGAAWLIIGPVCLLFLLNAREPGYGAEWQWGIQDTTSTAEYAQFIGEIENNQGEVINEVSWLFNRYNILISDFILQSIGIILNNNVNERIKPMARQRMMDFMFSSSIQSENLKSLIHVHHQHCSDDMQRMRTIALGRRHTQFRTSSYYKGIIEHNASYDQSNITIRKNTAAHSALNDIFNGYRDPLLENTELGFPQSNAFDTCRIPDQVPPSVSCRQIWCWMAMGLQTEVHRLQEEAENTYVGAAAGDRAFKEELWQDIVVKMSDTNLVVGDSSNAVEPDLSLIPVIIGGHLMKKEVLKNAMSSGFTQLSQHSGYIPSNTKIDFEKMSPEKLQELTRKFQKEQFSEPERFRIYTLAIYMPYVQGVCLYILGLTFPFFALMILVPGRAGAFFQWMGLWFWVKFWDLGWAFVVVVDDILWELMPKSAYYDIRADANDSPITYFDAAFSGDPAYSMGMYYALIGVMITGVPVVSAQVLLGSKAAIGNTLVQGMNQVSQRWGGAIKNAIAPTQTTGIEQLRLDHASNFNKDGFTSSQSQALQKKADSLMADSAAMGALASEALTLGSGGAIAVGAAKAILGGSGGKKKVAALQNAGAITSSAASSSLSLWQGSVNLAREAQTLRRDAVYMSESQRHAAAGRTATEFNLQGLAGATRDRVGNWFGMQAVTQATQSMNQRLNVAELRRDGIVQHQSVEAALQWIGKEKGSPLDRFRSSGKSKKPAPSGSSTGGSGTGSGSS